MVKSKEIREGRRRSNGSKNTKVVQNSTVESNFQRKPREKKHIRSEFEDTGKHKHKHRRKSSSGSGTGRKRKENITSDSSEPGPCVINPRTGDQKLTNSPQINSLEPLYERSRSFSRRDSEKIPVDPARESPRRNEQRFSNGKINKPQPTLSVKHEPVQKNLSKNYERVPSNSNGDRDNTQIPNPNLNKKEKLVPIVKVPLMQVLGEKSIEPEKKEMILPKTLKPNSLPPLPPPIPKPEIVPEEILSPNRPEKIISKHSINLKSFIEAEILKKDQDTSGDNEKRRLVKFNSIISTRSHPPQHRNSLDEISRYTKATVYPGIITDEQILIKSPGLVVLNKIEKVFIKHKRYVMDGCIKCCSRIEDQYHLLNPSGHELFHVVLESARKKKCFGVFQQRAYGCYDADDNLVIKIVRVPIFGAKVLRRLKVSSPANNVIGYIDQLTNIFVPTFVVKDHEQNIFTIIKMDSFKCPCKGCILGPWTWCCRKNRVFSIKTLRGAPRGRIRGDWDDLGECLEAIYPHFGVNFPGEMSVVIKTLIVAASIIVYRRFFHNHPARIDYSTPYMIMEDRKKFLTGSKLSIIESRVNQEQGVSVPIETILDPVQAEHNRREQIH